MVRALAAWSSVISVALCASCAGSDGGSEPNHGSILPSAGRAAGGGAGSSAVGASGGSAGVSSASSGAANGAAASSGSANAGSANAGAVGLGGAATGPSDSASKTALEQLKAWLAFQAENRPALLEQAFAKVPLTKADSAEAQQLLVADYTAQLKATRSAEVGATESLAKTI